MKKKQKCLCLVKNYTECKQLEIYVCDGNKLNGKRFRSNNRLPEATGFH